MKFTKDNSFLICHRCLYCCYLKSDMINHYNRKNICDIKYCSTNDFDFNDYKELSLKKRYYSEQKLKHYPESVLIKFITTYHNEINNIDDINNNFDNTTNNFDNITNNNEQDIKNCVIFIIDNKKVYKCLKCGTLYKKKDSLLNHLQNDKLCYKKKIFNDYIKKCEEIKQDNENSKLVIQNNQKSGEKIVINNQNNNIQNNNINDYGNYKLKLRDFFLEGYSIDHIDLDKLNYNDFYLYDNMLNLILENDENKNIYFDNNNAIFYTKNNLSVLPNDKAVYVLLEKMGRVANKIINLQDEELQNKLNHVKDYYRINLNKYKFDTLFKKYDVNEKRFIYDSDVPQNIRTRDECIQTTIGIINNYEDETQEIFKNKKLNTKKLPPPMPYNIEDYLSVKDRYKELKDDY